MDALLFFIKLFFDFFFSSLTYFQDMDMLQLFASPAGRALVAGDNRPATRGGSTSTSLSRESSSRAKSSRRTSSTFGVPTPPPRQRKSSAELYKEAVEILGLTCSLTDSCRCLDCQVIHRFITRMSPIYSHFPSCPSGGEKTKKKKQIYDIYTSDVEKTRIKHIINAR